MSTSKNPYILDASDNTLVKNAPNVSQKSVQKNPFVLDANDNQFVKKKVGGSESLNGESQSASRLPSQDDINNQTSQPQLTKPYDSLTQQPTTLLPEALHMASVNYKNGDLTADDISVLSDTPFGNEVGLAQIPADKRDVAAQTHNIVTKGDIAPAINNITQTYFPVISKTIKNPDALFTSFKDGNPDAIKSVKDNITGILQSKINDINNTASSAYAELGGTPENYLSDADKKTIENLRGQINSINNNLNDYAKIQLFKQQQGISTDGKIDYKKLGEDYTKYSGEDAARDELAKKVNPKTYIGDVASQNINYKNELLGTQIAAENFNNQAASNIYTGLTTNNQQQIDTGDSHIENLNATNEYAKNLLQKYPSVGVDQVSSYIGDIVSEAKSGWNPFTTQSDVDAAVQKVKKETPEIYNQYKDFFNKLTPSSISNRGGFGGIGAGFNDLGFNIASLFMSDKEKAAQETIRENQANIKGTKFSEPLQVVYDKDGKAFRQVQNENYTGYSWYGAGKQLPSLAAWIALSTATGGAIDALATTEVVGALGTEGILDATTKIGANAVAKNFISNAIPSYVLSHSQNRDLAEQLINDDSTTGEIKKNVVANALTLATPLVFGIADYSPSEIMQNSIKQSVAKDFINMINEKGLEGLTKDDFSNWVKGSVVPKVLAVAKSAGENISTAAKGSTAMMLNQKANDVISLMANPKAKTSSLNDNINAFVQGGLTIMATALPGMIAKGFSPSYKDIAYRVSLFPDEYLQLNEKALQDGEITQQVYNNTAKIINTLKESSLANPSKLNDKGLPIINRQQRDLVISDFRKRAAKGLEGLGTPIDASKVESETDAENKNVLSQNYLTDIEETPAFKYIQQNNPDIKTYQDLQSSIGKPIKYIDENGNEKESDAAEVIQHLSTDQNLDNNISSQNKTSQNESSTKGKLVQSTNEQDQSKHEAGLNQGNGEAQSISRNNEGQQGNEKGVLINNGAVSKEAAPNLSSNEKEDTQVISGKNNEAGNSSNGFVSSNETGKTEKGNGEVVQPQQTEINGGLQPIPKEMGGDNLINGGIVEADKTNVPANENIVYHGTPKKFDKLKSFEDLENSETQEMNGVHFNSTKEGAQRFGKNIIAKSLDGLKLYDASDKSRLQLVVDWLMKNKHKTEEEALDMARNEKTFKTIHDLVLDRIEMQGYDGIKLANEYKDGTNDYWITRDGLSKMKDVEPENKPTEKPIQPNSVVEGKTVQPLDKPIEIKPPINLSAEDGEYIPPFRSFDNPEEILNLKKGDKVIFKNNGKYYVAPLEEDAHISSDKDVGERNLRGKATKIHVIPRIRIAGLSKRGNEIFPLENNLSQEEISKYTSNPKTNSVVEDKAKTENRTKFLADEKQNFLNEIDKLKDKTDAQSKKDRTHLEKQVKIIDKFGMTGAELLDKLRNENSLTSKCL